ncbi:DNA (cytosine-5)-methyltransferase 1 [Rhodopseudomonas pseudopalustris]|uniref:DNA (Cytosine-5)-methyltransferase 1 n=1 Tax=Rhodopseudomonas pseudopalustris TaxID=1513892 RepID=A0A1H8WHU4_9BRAD|nr:DNA (cytosine-5)-methyltransferase 1 [Rhodopseudomonas pseudopalustris]
MTAYYNEIDPFAAAWLRNLIVAGHIAPGDVDERDIRDVRPSDLRGYRQVHLFAGIGVWSRAFRGGGIRDDEHGWSASCPCPPFSSAGKKKACPSCGGTNPVPHVGRTGYFVCCGCGHAWLADDRHLWPEVWRLARDCRPGRIYGEQVASNDGRIWIDTVCPSLEILGYTSWAVDTCAAGFGAPHIRQRLYWVADANRDGRAPGSEGRAPVGYGAASRAGSSAYVMGDAERSRLEGHSGHGNDRDQPGRFGALTSRSATAAGAARELDNAVRDGRRPRWVFDAEHDGDFADAASRVQSGGVADATGRGQREQRSALEPGHVRYADGGSNASGGVVGGGRNWRPGPTNGLWQDPDWLLCRDDKWRPVEPGAFPLAHGLAGRVGRLRAYGNAVNLAQAEGFVRAANEAIEHLRLNVGVFG